MANVVIYLITVAQGAGLNDPGGSLFTKWALFGPAVHHGDWWRLITSAFLHGSVLHIVFNMLALWWLGAPVEMALGRARYLGLYLVSGLAGAAGALIANPNSVTVGASGAIFGLLGAGLILEWQATGSLAGNYLDPDPDQPRDQLRAGHEHLGRRPHRRADRRHRWRRAIIVARGALPFRRRLADDARPGRGRSRVGRDRLLEGQGRRLAAGDGGLDARLR